MPNLMTSAAGAGPGLATTSATAVKSATKASETRSVMAITPRSARHPVSDSQAQICFLHALVTQEVLRVAFHHELAGLQHVAVLREGQRQHRVLLHQDDRDVERVDLTDDLADLR